MLKSENTSFIIEIDSITNRLLGSLASFVNT